jgi:hypothetical protein
VGALAHGICLFFAGAVFFSLAFLLSTGFTDIWRPLLIALGIAVFVGVTEGLVFHDLARYGIFGIMSGETYFRTGTLPWAGLALTAALSAALLYGATLNIARRDF